MRFFSLLANLHEAFFGTLERLLKGWFIELSARFVFCSVLLLYFVNSAWLKAGESVFGFLAPGTGAFASILPSIMEQAGFDTSAIAFFPYHLIVILGTAGELFLPLMIAVGLFSRIAAIGMVIFIFVQSYVDIAFHGLEEKFIGSMFDRVQDAVIWDQRLLWVFPLLVTIIMGPGKVSLDHLLARFKK